jgi:photosystem II stability/assembly factor-like uncharacterized protein
MILIISSMGVFSKWEELNDGLGGARVPKIDVNNDYIFLIANTDGGIYRLDKSGGSWQLINNGLEDKGLKTMAVSDDMIVISAGKGNLFLSEDNGMTWDSVNYDFEQKTINDVQIYNNEIFINWSNKGIFSSTDKGNNWINRTENLTDKMVSGFKIIGDTIIVASGKSIMTDKIINISTDNGITWNTKSEGLETGTYYTKILTYNGLIILPTRESGVFYSSNFGDSWSKIAGNFSGSTLYINDAIVKDGFIHLATTFHGSVTLNLENLELYSTNNGLLDKRIYSLAKDENFVYVGSDYNGVFRTSDNGENWEQIPVEGLKNIYVTNLFRKDDKIYLSSYSGIAEIQDGNDNWKNIPNKIGTNWFYKIFLQDNILFVASGNGMFKSSDNGIYWDSCNHFTSINDITANEDYIYICVSGTYGIWRTSDYGMNWEKYNDSLSFVNSIKFYDDFIFVATQKNGLRYSTDGGDIWQKVSLIYSPPEGINAVIKVGANIYVGSTNTGLYKSNDNGETWKLQMTSTNMDLEKIKIFKSVGDNIFAATSQGVYLTQDKGFSWRDITEDLTKLGINTLEITDKYIYVGTSGNGVFRAKLSDFGIVDVGENRITNNFSIYPLPASEQVNMSLELDMDAYVSMSVTDVFGKRVATILDNEYYSSGQHSVEFNTVGLSAGIYFCTVKVGSRIETRKIVVLD